MFRGANLAGADLSWSDVDLHWEENLNPDWAVPDLYAANLSRLTLLYADFSGANLGRASLVHATLDGDLTDADFKKIVFAIFEFFSTETKFGGASFERANLANADLFEADLRGVNLKGANLEGANLSRANLMGARSLRRNLNADLKERFAYGNQ